MSKRVLAMALAILAFFIFVGSPFESAAAAIAVVDDALVAIIIAALAAMGIIITSSRNFQDIKHFVNDVIDDFCLDNDTTVNSLFSGVQSGSSNLGKLILNNRFITVIQAIGAYIVQRFSLSDNVNVQALSTNSSIGGFLLYDLPFGLYTQTGSGIRYEQYVGEGYVLLENNLSGNGVYLMALSTTANSVIKKLDVYANGNVRESELTLNRSGNTFWYTDGGSAYDKSSFNLTSYNVYPAGTVSNLAASNFPIVEGSEYSIDIGTTTIVLPNQDQEYSNGDGAILDVSAAWGMDYDEITFEVLPNTYEDATIEYDNEAAVAEIVTDTPIQSVSPDAASYQSPGLQSVFPFCIPFDIYAFFECLAAEPEAPSFTWRFYIPGICDEELEIDLAAFDSAARILRTMELLLFIVGLAFVTRDKFLRG